MSRERDLDDEVETHLAEAADDYVARGLSPTRRDMRRCVILAASPRPSKCIARCGVPSSSIGWTSNSAGACW